MEHPDPSLLEQALEVARRVQARAYAPYSHFPVGAAIITANGAIIPGCNVENASFGLTQCAERAAITRMIADGEQTPVAVVVVGPAVEPLTPCGACRQVLAEFNRQMKVLCVGTEGARLELPLSALLPHSFGADDLEKAKE